MTESPKFTDKAADLAAQAAAAAGPLMDKAGGIAMQAAAAAGPVAAQARERASVLAAQAAAAAAPLAAQARERAAQGVEVLADNLDKITGGKYSDRIGSLTSRLGGALGNTGASAEPPVSPVADPLVTPVAEPAVIPLADPPIPPVIEPEVSPVAEPTHFASDDDVLSPKPDPAP